MFAAEKMEKAETFSFIINECHFHIFKFHSNLNT